MRRILVIFLGQLGFCFSPRRTSFSPSSLSLASVTLGSVWKNTTVIVFILAGISLLFPSRRSNRKNIKSAQHCNYINNERTHPRTDTKNLPHTHESRGIINKEKKESMQDKKDDEAERFLHPNYLFNHLFVLLRSVFPSTRASAIVSSSLSQIAYFLLILLSFLPYLYLSLVPIITLGVGLLFCCFSARALDLSLHLTSI